MISDNYQPTKDIGNGVTVNFAFTWNLLVESYLRVYLENKDTGVQTLQVNGSDYTVVWTESGGTVTFSTAPTSQYYVIIARVIPLKQQTPYTTSKGFEADVVEDSFDLNTAQIQQVSEAVERCPKIPLGSSQSINFPLPEDTKLIGWNGTNLTNFALTAITAIESDITLVSGDAGKVVKVKSSEDGYEVESLDDSLDRMTGAPSANDFIYHNGTSWGKKSITEIMPSGVIFPYGAATAPTGFLLCDGTAISRTEHADLFSIIGTTYGSGDGSTTFNVPNIKGRIPVGLDSAQTEFDALGETGGAKTHTLTESEMPAHTHDVSGGSTNASIGGFGNFAGGSSGATSSSTGGGNAHNNLQPYIVLNYIIKSNVTTTDARVTPEGDTRVTPEGHTRVRTV